MPIDISPLTPTKQLSGFASRNQDLLEELGIQIASGIKYQSYGGFAKEGNLEKLLSINASLEGFDSFKRSNNAAIARVRSAREAVDQIQNIASDVAQLITNRRNSASGSSIAVDLLGQAALERIASNLNVQFDGRFLFAGSKINTRPVENIFTSNVNSDTGEVNARYYNGDSVKPVVRSSSTEEVEYGILANETAFQQLIGAVHLAIEGHNDSDDSLLADAMDMVNSAISNIASIRSTASTTLQRLEGINQVLADAETLNFEDKTDISATDIVEATTQMAAGEATLQAVYIALNRITRLSLTNFIS